jgi:hypothetical protein
LGDSTGVQACLISMMSRLITVPGRVRASSPLPNFPSCSILIIVTDEELASRTALFNQTLMQYGRAKALHSALGSTVYEDGLLDALALLLDEIKIEIERRRRHEEKEQAAASG